MLSIAVLILALALAGPVKSFVDDARNVSTDTTIGMDCTNSSISNFDKGACIVSDLSIFYFIGGLIFVAGAVLTAKIVFG